MKTRPLEDAALMSDAALHGMARNRMTAFAPIVVALLGIGILAATNGGRDQQTLMGAAPAVDTIITGSITAEPEL